MNQLKLPAANTTDLSWEVLIARNLEHPKRYFQEYYWLELSAATQRQAVQIALEWALNSSESYEATDMVRPSGSHPESLGYDHKGVPLQVIWTLPVLSTAVPQTSIRNPRNGKRVGYVAFPEDEAKWLPKKTDQYRLLVSKPFPGAKPVCISPLVYSAELA